MRVMRVVHLPYVRFRGIRFCPFGILVCQSYDSSRLGLISGFILFQHWHLWTRSLCISQPSSFFVITDAIAIGYWFYGYIHVELWRYGEDMAHCQYCSNDILMASHDVLRGESPKYGCSFTTLWLYRVVLRGVLFGVMVFWQFSRDMAH